MASGGCGKLLYMEPRIYLELELEVPPESPPSFPTTKPEKADDKVTYEVDLTVKAGMEIPL